MNVIFSKNNYANVFIIKLLVLNESSFNEFKIKLFTIKHFKTKHLIKIATLTSKVNHYTLHSPNVKEQCKGTTTT